MKHTFSLFFLGWIAFSVAQTKPTYIDSLEQAITKFSAKQKLKAINEIPYGDFVAEVEKAERLFKKGEKLAIQLKDSTSLGDLFYKLGQLKVYQNKLDESLAYSLKAITIFENNKNFSKAGMVYGGLGYNLKAKNLEKALYYMRKGIKLLEDTNDLERINPVYDNYGVLLSMSNNNDSALYYQKKSLSIKKQLKDSVGLGYGYANIANTFAEKRNFILAKKYVDSSSIIRNKIADNYGITVNYVQKAEIFVLEKKYNEAIEDFKTCARLSQKYKYKHLEQYCYQNLSKCYVELKDYKNAFDYKEKFQIVKDSADNIITNAKVEELQIEFETEKKEKLLAEAKVDLLAKEAKIKKRTTFLISALALAFLLGLIGFLVYKQQRLKNKQLVKENELRQALIKIENQNNLQEQRLAISKDLHDNIGSQLTFIISSLDNLKYFEFTKDKLYTKFDSIGTFTRSTITDLRDTIWAMNKEAITFEDLKTRTTNFIEAAKTSLLGITFEFNYPKNTDEVTLNSLQGIDVYRIIQEAVNNAVKHAEATKIIVNFELIKNTLEVSISDNGKGFDKETIEAGNGLASMKKRAQEINANLSIEPLEQGTKVCLKFNLE
ncbi:ATP-binding protein [Flavobacterium sp. N2270]|uniref:tetratricopeptide repeat-containing sensor histidine kinase n=1 Tax=Flavobacterium sp. N2270 TaxID=2986831 RepID=UPI0022246152|nr:ATP-binding protein [Flavobacterium sp. N2270]